MKAASRRARNCGSTNWEVVKICKGTLKQRNYGYVYTIALTFTTFLLRTHTYTHARTLNFVRFVWFSYGRARNTLNCINLFVFVTQVPFLWRSVVFFKYIIKMNFSLWGFSVTQDISRWPPSRSAFDPRPIHVGFVVDRVALRLISLRVLRFSLSLSFNQWPILYSPRPTSCSYQKDKRANPGDLPKSNSFSEIR